VPPPEPPPPPEVIDPPSATGMSYASEPVEFADHGAVFAAVVTNSAGSVTSDPAILSVIFNQLTTADDVFISVDSVTIRVDDVQV
jgi:zona occludens toxin (predicted ATPase)